MGKKTIVIEREYASGGEEIGKKTAETLGIPCYGKEILEMAAEKLGMSKKELEREEETMTGSFLYSLYAFSQFTSGETKALTKAQQLNIMESQIIQSLSLNGPCIFIGRCAAAALQNTNDVLTVFIRADMDFRLKRAIEVYHKSQSSAERFIRRYDKKRAAFYKGTTGNEWKDPENYHIMIDSSYFGIDKTVTLLCDCVTK